MEFPTWYPDWLEEATAQLVEKYGRFGTQFNLDELKQYSYDLRAGTLTFFKDGVPSMVAEIQVVGTTSEKVDNWLWGWANSQWPDSCVMDVLRVHEFGEKHGIEELTTGSRPGNGELEKLAWHLTAAAVRIVDAMSAYRMQRDDDGGGCFLLIKSMTGVGQDQPRKSGWRLPDWIKRSAS